MIIFLAIFFLLLTQVFWYLLTSISQSTKLNYVSFNLSLLFVAILLAFFSKNLNLTSFMVFVFIILWNLWQSLYKIYTLNQAESTDFSENLDRNANIEFYKKQSLKLALAILPLVIVSLSSKITSIYFGINYFLIFSGILIWITGFLIEILIAGQKIGLKELAKSSVWHKDGVWKFTKLKSSLPNTLVWLGIILLVASSLFF